MGFRPRSAALILCSLLSGSVAVSLGDLGLAAPPSSESAACRKAFSSSITSCSLSDFDNGCSKSCTAGVTKTFDGLTSECSPRYVSTLLGSNLSSAGVKLLCAKSSPLPEKEPATPKSSSSSAQQTSSESAKETSSTTTPVPTSTDQPEETISPITSSSTTRKPGNPGSPVISKGPPPDVATLQPATTTTSEPTSSQSSTSTPTSTLSEPETSSSSSIVTSSSATQKATPKAAGSITAASSSAASSTRSPVITSTQSANSTAALPAGATGKEEPQKHKKSSTGPIVGGILGGVALIVLLIIFLFYSIIRPQRRRQQEEDEDYNQKAATTTHTTVALTTDTTPPKDPIYSAANPYNNQTPTLPTLVTKMPYRSNSQRSGVSELARHDSRLSMRSVNRSNSLTDRYDVSPIDRFGNPMWDPYSPPDRYGAYVSPPMDDRYGPYSTSTMNTHRYDPTGVAPISFMEAEWNQLRGQQPMRQNSYSKSRPNFINYPSVIQEERESVSATSGQSSVYELGNDGNASKTSVRRSEDNNNKKVSTRRSEDKIRIGTPDLSRKSPLRVVNGAPEN